MEDVIDPVAVRKPVAGQGAGPVAQTHSSGQPSLDQSTASNFVRHRGPVTSTADIPGRRIVVSGGYDGAVALFDLDADSVTLLGYHRHLVNQVSVDQIGGQRAASCSSDYSVYIWDLETGQRIQVLQGHADDVEDFIFVDTHTGVSASRDRRIIVWNLETGAIRHILDAHEKDVLSLSYSDGLLYSSGDDKTLKVWDVEQGRLLKSFGPFELETDTCAIDPARGRVVLGCDDGIVRVIEVNSGKIVCEIEAHSSGIKKVAVSPTGDILSAAYDQKIIIWCGETFAHKLTLENVKHKWERSFSFSYDGSRIYAGTFDGTLLMWNAVTGELTGEAGSDGEGNACFNRVAASDNGAVVTVADDGWIRLAAFDSKWARWMNRTCPGSGRMLMNAVAIDNQGGLVVSGAHDQKLHLYSVDRYNLDNHIEIELNEGPINFIDIATQEDYEQNAFVACYSGKIVCVTPSGEVRARMQIHEGAVKSVRVHQHEKLGVSCSADGTLCSWTFDGEIVNHYLGHSAIINDVAFSPDGDRIASVSRDFSLKVYGFSDAKLIASIELGRRSLKSVCFASRNVVLVGDYWGGLFRVDLQSGKVERQKIAGNGLSSLTRSGNKLFAASYDGSISEIDPSNLGVVHRIEALTQCLNQAM